MHWSMEISGDAGCKAISDWRLQTKGKESKRIAHDLWGVKGLKKCEVEEDFCHRKRRVHREGSGVYGVWMKTLFGELLALSAFILVS